MVALRPSDLRPDVPATQLGALFARVVCAVAVQRPRPAPWPAPAPAHGRDLVDEWDQLGDVVAVAAGERAGKRSPFAAEQQVPAF